MPAPKLADHFSTWEVQDASMRFGMWAFLGQELMLFAGLFGLYASYRYMYGADFENAISANDWRLGSGNTLILLSSSFTAALAVWSARENRTKLIPVMLVLTMLAGFAFMGIKAFEYHQHWEEGLLPGRFYHADAELVAKFGIATFGANRFFTLYWVMTGLHGLHVLVGIGVVGWCLRRSLQKGYYSSEHNVGLELGMLYWHLVDVMWIFIWPLLYLG